MRFAPMDDASNIRNFPCAALTAMSGRPLAALFLSTESSVASFSKRKELWYVSDLAQSSVDITKKNGSKPLSAESGFVQVRPGIPK